MTGSWPPERDWFGNGAVLHEPYDRSWPDATLIRTGLTLRRSGDLVQVAYASKWVAISHEKLMDPDRDPAVLDVQAEGDVIVVCGTHRYRHQRRWREPGQIRGGAELFLLEEGPDGLLCDRCGTHTYRSEEP